MNEEDPTTKVRKFTLLDVVLGVAGCVFVAVVIYRYETQDYFDSAGLWKLAAAIGLYLGYRRGQPLNPNKDGADHPGTTDTSPQQNLNAVVLWVIWLSMTCSIPIYQFMFGHGLLWGDDARSATQNPIYWFSAGVLAIAAIVRWVLMPMAPNSRRLLVLLIIGMALSESVEFYSIFLFPADMPQTKMGLFALSLLSALQFVPVYARTASPPRVP